MTKVKICGITNIGDALAAIEYGADALGFVFAPSPRQVTASIVRDIVGMLPPFICKVGVFAGSEIRQVVETMSFCSLDLAQLHSDEGPDYCAALFPRVIKAFTPENLPPPGELSDYQVAAYMLDKAKNSAVSDTDQMKLWQTARHMKDYGPVILAGGLTPENLGEAIEVARPYAVDVSSSIEAEPGRKDHGKLLAFIRTAKQACTGGNVDITR